MSNQSMELFLSEFISVQDDIRKLLERGTPDVQLTPTAQPSKVLSIGNAVRVYFEGRGARTISEKTIVTWSLGSTPVLVGINEDPILLNAGSGYGTGIQLYQTTYSYATALQLDVPVEYLSFIIAGNVANTYVGVLAESPNPANDDGYIRIYGWSSKKDLLVPHGSR